MKKQSKFPVSIAILLALTGILVIVSLLIPYIRPIDLGATDLRSRLALPSIFGYSDSGLLFG